MKLWEAVRLEGIGAGGGMVAGAKCLLSRIDWQKKDRTVDDVVVVPIINTDAIVASVVAVVTVVADDANVDGVLPLMLIPMLMH